MNRIFIALLLPFVVNTIDRDHEPEDAFQKDCLDAHNTYRAEHGVPPLAWSLVLTRQAQKWADVLALKDEVKHNDEELAKNNEGENLAYFRPAVPKCQDSMVGNCILCREMVKRWYDEVKFYDFDNGAGLTPEAVTKHFTQIIWSNTSEVGIGTAISKKYGFITVARYWPQGNKGGPEMYILNVPPEGGPLPLPSNDTPTKAVGIPETISPKETADDTSKTNPKTKKVSQDVNDTQLADLASQDPHQQTQNDDMGNTFDSHMNKDFGYEGQKMYGDSHKGDIEYNIQVDSAQGNPPARQHGKKAYDSPESGVQMKHSRKKGYNNDDDGAKSNSDAESVTGKSDDVVYDSNMENQGSLQDYNGDSNNGNDLNNEYSTEDKESNRNNGYSSEDSKENNANNGYTTEDENNRNNEYSTEDKENNTNNGYSSEDSKENNGNNGYTTEDKEFNRKNGYTMEDNKENNRNNGYSSENNSDLNNGNNGYTAEDKDYNRNDGFTSEDREYNGYSSIENNKENNENNEGNDLSMENNAFFTENKQRSGYNIEDERQNNNKNEVKIKDNIFNINRVNSGKLGALVGNIAGTRNRHLTPSMSIQKNDGSNSQSIRETLKNKGLVRTVKGPDGSSAQVFLTKNGAHAGLVFRNHISRASSLRKAKEPETNRVIYVV